jgi:SOS-response transcriptional repressor LexA
LIQHLCKFISDLQHVDGILQVQSNLYSTAAAKFPVPVHNDSYITVTGRHFIGKHG